MKSINPYLNFPGNTEEAFNFYKKVFGGDFVGGINRFKDIPDGGKLSTEDQEKVMHIGLKMGKGNYLLATDAHEFIHFRECPISWDSPLQQNICFLARKMPDYLNFILKRSSLISLI